MPESGEWFSPRTRPEMLTSDDPPIQNEKPELVQILPGPATAVGRATAPLRRLVGFVPSIGRRIVRVDDEPSRWQLVGMWTSGSAIVAATGLAIAAVLGGAPPALTQPFERLAVLPGIVGPHTQSDEAQPSSSDAKPATRHQASDLSRHSSGSSSSSSSYGYSGGSSGGSSSSAAYYPEDLIPGRAAVPGVASAGAPLPGGHTSAGTTTGGHTGGNPAPPAGGGTTAPAPDPTTAPPVTDPTEGPTDPGTPPTDPGPPTEDPTDPAPPTEEPTDPAPPVDTPPVDPPTAEPTPESPPDAPPNDPPADDPSPADPTQDQPVDPPAPTPEAPPATP